MRVRKYLSRAAVFGIGRKYEGKGGRARYLMQELGRFVEGSVLDVGAGSNAAIFASAFGARYQALDIGDSYKITTPLEKGALRHVADIEGKDLPFADQEFETVLCMDVLEHLDDCHKLLDELFRVSSGHVVVSLPNNWPAFLWSFIAGRNVTHRAGYGLGAQPKRPGQRHKHFFNLEEACDFLLGRVPAGFEVERVDFRFEHGNDGLVASIPGLSRPVRLAGAARLADARERFGAAGPLVWAVAKLGLLPLRALDLAVSALLYGWGNPVRFYNLHCRQIWVVYRRISPPTRSTSYEHAGLAEVGQP